MSAEGDSPIRGAAVVAGFLLGGPSALYAGALALDGPHGWGAALVVGAPGASVLAATFLFLRGRVSGSVFVVVMGLALVAWAVACLGLSSGWGD